MSVSAVWTYFTVSTKDTRIAVCNTCKAEVMRGGCRVKSFNTTNLISHLKNRHPEVHKQYQEANASKQPKTTTAAAAVASPIQQALDKTRKFAKDSAKAKSITDKVMEMIALDDQPLSMVEDRGFRQLLEHIEPRYSLPCRRYFSDVSLPALYEVVATHIHKMLDSSVNDISFTTYIWSSDVSQMSMLSLTAQWIDDNFEMRRAVLHAQEFAGSHTGTAIASAFDCMFAQWKIPKENVHVVLRDNARNMQKAMDECGVKSVGCMAHTLQLAVHEGVLSQRSWLLGGK